MDHPDPEIVCDWLKNFQSSVIAAMKGVDSSASFGYDQWERPGGGGGVSCACTTGQVFEKAGVNFSDVQGTSLPASATATRPQLAGRPFRAMGVSMVMHPRNPYCPTSHANIRFMVVGEPGENTWWFGGGLDLTPYYGFVEDAVEWHQQAAAACEPFGKELYPRFKSECDRYFFLKHRQEARGIGGLFFDDFNEVNFDHAFGLAQSVGQAYAPTYAAILRKRHHTPYKERERQFQLYRRGRYVEFNLIYDRGTLFGLQSGGRTESILMSLPPLVRWEYNLQPEPGSPEARLTDYFLKPRDWLNETPTS